ncbi:MAG: NlpC/P60 family protein [Candidatus Limnocylindrales bacterium]
MQVSHPRLLRAGTASSVSAILLVAFIASGFAPQARGSTLSVTYVSERLSHPNRTIVTSATGTWLATFTDGARSVALSGPSRTFAEPSTTAATVTTTTWLRLLPTPFGGTVSESWLTAALADTSIDVLGAAMQYVAGSPDRLNATGLRIAGDANYGPLRADGSRAAGSDFNDYLGLRWTYADGTQDQAESNELGSLDCSGFVRMTFGYRSGIPMSLKADSGGSLPRHSWDIATSAPGVALIPNLGTTPASRSGLQPGDLVFFDATSTDGHAIDHVGIFLGLDSQGHDRFLSSRKTANGPTLGDLGGRSTLDGTGLYATSFRSARRI